MYQVDKERQAPIIPPVPAPKGLKFFSGTWSGRIIILNTIIFILHSLYDGNFLNPSSESLVAWGAKDNFLLVEGQLWRFLTPIVLHVGLIHYAFNNWALYALGYQIEHLIGKRWFVALYLLSGIGGNIASSLFSLGLSAGASSSLFGLLGAGFYLERVVGARLNKDYGKAARPSMYSGMVIANLVLGFMIPQIDNAAHIGGLLSGVTLAYVLLRMKPNRLLALNPKRSKIVLGFFLVSLVLGGGLASSKIFLKERLNLAYLTAEEPRAQFRYLTQILRLSPDDDDAKLARLELSLRYGNYSIAKVDFFQLMQSSRNDVPLNQVESKLIQDGHMEAAEVLRQLRSATKSK